MKDKERITRLPQWAQDEIKRLEANADYWQKKANAAMSPDAKHTNTYVRDYLQQAKLGLPPDSRVCFKLGLDEEDVIECCVRDNTDGEKRLSMMTPRALIVRPSTANVIELVVTHKY